MNEYLNMWKNCTDFSGKASVRDYWMAILVNAIINTVVSLTLTVYSSYEPDLSILSTLYSLLYTLAILLPGLSLTVRRLNDVGKNWTYMFINLIPVVGSILFLVTLCKSPSCYGSSKIIYDPDVWICESCGTRNNNSAVTCKDCGNFRSRKVTVSEATASSDQNVWICKSCGGKNSLGSNFCNECGIRRS